MKSKGKKQNIKIDANGRRLPGRYKAAAILLLLDVLFAFGAYWAARGILFYRGEIVDGNYYSSYEIPVMLIMVGLTIAAMIFFDCYSSVWKYAGRVEFLKFLLSYIVSCAVMMLLKIVMHIAFGVVLPVPLILMYILFSALVSGFARFIHIVVSYGRHVHNLVDDKTIEGKRTLIIGAGYTGALAINRFINNPTDGYFPVALLDDDPEKTDRKICGVRVEGGLDRLDCVMEQFRVEAIVIAIMTLSKSQLKRIYSRCSGFNVPIKIMPAITDAGSFSNRSLSLRDIRVEELLGREEFKVRQELIDEAVKDKVVCVTGGAGSIGSELCRQALHFGCKHLVIFDMHENGMFALNEELKNVYAGRYTLVVGTVRERAKLKETFDRFRPQVVFHAAAYKHVPMMEIAPTEAIKNNVFGTLNVIEQSMESGVEKFILISTDKAVNPANVMGASKRIAEMLIQARGRKSSMCMAAVRFGNVLGSNGSVIPTFLRQIQEGGPITLTDRNIRRYFMTIPEAVRLVLQTGALADNGEVFVLDMGDPIYIYDMACDLIRINGLVPEKDIEIKIVGLRPGEKLFEELRYDKEMVDETQHEGIFVTRLQHVDEAAFVKRLNRLKELANAEDEVGTVREIFRLVPDTFRHTFVSEQSASQSEEVRSGEERTSA